MSDNSKFLSGLLLGALAGAALTAFLNSEKGKAFLDNLKAEAADLKMDMEDKLDATEESLQAMLDKAKKLVSDLEEKIKENPAA
jgi:gas vesicle protein